MDWDEVLQKKDIITLNIGGGGDCHPKENYINHVAVDLRAKSDWGISYDLTQKIPLPDNSIKRIISEHFFEHVKKDDVVKIFNECYRVLKTGGNMRVAVPDYNHPSMQKYLNKGSDPNHTDHVWLPILEEFREIVKKSDFSNFEFKQYWTIDGFVNKGLDKSLGYIKRIPEIDKRNRKNKFTDYVDCYAKSLGHIIYRSFTGKKIFLDSIRGNKHKATSIVVDMFK